MHSKTNIMHKNKDRKKNQFKKIFREQIFPYIILTLVGLLFLAPFAWLVITSLKTEKEIFHIPLILWPGDFQWGNYLNAINYIPFLKYTLNTLIIAVLAIIGQVISSPLVAYSFARLKYKGRDILFYIMLSTIMLPFQVTMIPLYIMFNDWGMINTYWPLVLPHFFGAPFYIFLLRQFFLTIPHELTEAARIDGASEFRIYWQVILPLAKPAVLTVSLFTFLAVWGDFLGPLIYLNDPDKWTLSIGLQSFIGEHTVRWGLLMAAAAMFAFPVIILYFFVQKKFIEGISMTGIK